MLFTRHTRRAVVAMQPLSLSSPALTQLDKFTACFKRHDASIHQQTLPLSPLTHLSSSSPLSAPAPSLHLQANTRPRGGGFSLFLFVAVLSPSFLLSLTLPLADIKHAILVSECVNYKFGKASLSKHITTIQPARMGNVYLREPVY